MFKTLKPAIGQLGYVAGHIAAADERETVDRGGSEIDQAAYVSVTQRILRGICIRGYIHHA